MAAYSALAGALGDAGLRERVFTRLASTGNADVRAAALELLAGDRAAAKDLLKRAEAGKVAVSAADRALAEKLRAHNDVDIDQMVARLWPTKPAVAAQEAEIARVRPIIAQGGGVPKKGETIFRARCASCHRMFDHGGSIGPDLTSYQRSDREALLMAIVAPGLEIREGYEHSVMRLKSGEVLSGFLVGEDEGSMSLRELSGRTRTLARSDIAKVSPSPASLMPPGLLGGLDGPALRDLFAYLRSTTPPF